MNIDLVYATFDAIRLVLGVDNPNTARAALRSRARRGSSGSSRRATKDGRPASCERDALLLLDEVWRKPSAA